MPQISLPKEFFVKERDGAYSSWKFAFWRELISNSRDANATKIDISHSGDTITFSDNGDGMSREVCESVYLSIGRSTKDADSKGVGGFGRARILTCFSMDSYTIHGNGYKVLGNGAEYTVTDGPALKGLLLEIKDSSFEGIMQMHLNNFLSLCNLPRLEIKLNGEIMESGRLFGSEWKDAPKVNNDFWADVSLVKSEHYYTHNNVIFRVNGMAMYNVGAWELPKGSCLLVDIKPAVSRQVLTANRDGVKPEYLHAVQQVLLEINQTGNLEDESKLLRKKTLYGKPHLLRSRVFGTTTALSPAALLPSPSAFNAANLLPRPDQPSRAYGAQPMILYISTRDPQLKTLAMSYEPGRERPGQRALLAAWDAAVDLAVQAAGRLGHLSSLMWFTGFCFCANQALHTKVQDQHTFLLNPYKKVDGNWTAAFTLTNQLTVQNLMSVAAHEVAHVFCSAHDAEYASFYTQIVGAMDWSRWRAVKEGLVAKDGLQ